MTEKQLKIMNIILLNIYTSMAVKGEDVFFLAHNEDFKKLVDLVQENCGDVMEDEL